MMGKLFAMAGTAAAFVTGVASVVLLLPNQAGADSETAFQVGTWDGCGLASGDISWPGLSGLPNPPVYVYGTVTDRPLPTDRPFPCRDDRYYTTATITAYAGGVAVGPRTATADNASVSFYITQQGTMSMPNYGGIDRLTIQVCRQPRNTHLRGYCAATVEYKAPPRTVPTGTLIPPQPPPPTSTSTPVSG
jgi:hypothetical protein